MKKQLVGTVVSDKMDKTIVVAVKSFKTHKKYKKQMKVVRRYCVHDAQNQAAIGDRVMIEEMRPMSRTKRWKLMEVINS